jgi:hypothetical protein
LSGTLPDALGSTHASAPVRLTAILSGSLPVLGSTFAWAVWPVSRFCAWIDDRSMLSALLKTRFYQAIQSPSSAERWKFQTW